MWTIRSYLQILKAHSSRELLTLPRQEPLQLPSCLSVYHECFMLYWEEFLHFAVVVILLSSIIFFSHGLFINSQLWGRKREVLSVTVLSQGALTRVRCRSCVPFQECRSSCTNHLCLTEGQTNNFVQPSKLQPSTSWWFEEHSCCRML